MNNRLVEFLLLIFSNITLTIISVVSLSEFDYKYGISEYLYVLHIGHRAIYTIGVIFGSTTGNLIMILIILKRKYHSMYLKISMVIFPIAISAIIFAVFLNPWLFYKLFHGIYFINIPMHLLLSCVYFVFLRLAIRQQKVNIM